MTHISTSMRRLAALILAGVATLAAPAAADAAIEVTDFEVTTSSTQAGGSTDVDIFVGLASEELPFAPPWRIPIENLRSLEVALPAGLVGDAAKLPTCARDQFWGGSQCPARSQVGVLHVDQGFFGPLPNNGVSYGPVFNLAPGPNQPAALGINLAGAKTIVNLAVRNGQDYGVDSIALNIPQGYSPNAIRMVLWDVPSDPVHDSWRTQFCLDALQRGDPPLSCPSPEPRVAFMRNPTDCSRPRTFTARASSYQEPNAYDTVQATLPPPTGCDAVDFKPEIEVAPDTAVAGAPTGLRVDIAVPENPSAYGPSSSALERAVVRFPEGMTLSPPVADGLAACSDAAFGLKDGARSTCPAESRIGSATVEVPALAEPLVGTVHVAEQRPGNPYRILVYAEGSGVRLKLEGSIAADPQTGRLTATFEGTPQVPFTRFSLEFKGGPRAPLVNPPTCGTKTVTAELTPYSGAPPATPSTSFAIACPGVPDVFEPGFAAGGVNPTAGAFSPFVLRITRDAGKELGRIDATLPKGLLADLTEVELCTGAQIAAAVGRAGRVAQTAPACPAGSQIGTATVGTGAGTAPFYPTLPGTRSSGRVFLTEAYLDTQRTLPGAGRPRYGLAIEVPAVAGPYDLGTVLVRAAVFVDPDTAQLTVLSDPMPRILQGIPLQLRDVRIEIDRARFMTNPTSCAAQRVAGTIHAQDGTTAARSSAFRVADCARLDLDPRVAMRLVGPKQMRTGGNPSLRVRLRQAAGQANLRTIKAVLPKSLALDASNTTGDWLCEFDAGQAASCPASSRIGTALAVSPLLKRPLRGPVYFVKGVRIHPRTGRRIRTLPTLLVKLDGEIAIHVRAKSEVDKDDRLVATFSGLPDAAISRFDLNLRGGARRGILAVTGEGTNLCRGRHVTRMGVRGQNGSLARRSIAMRPSCAKGKRASKRKR